MAYIKRNCSLDGCERSHCARGLCEKHYYAARFRGDLPTTWGPPQKESLEDTFAKRVDKTEGCWMWTGRVSTSGYGVLKRNEYAHRVAYRIATGDPAIGADIDHICRNRLCVNPEHLRKATRKQNVENHSGATRASKSGIRNVYFATRSGRWVVQVKHLGRSYSGGSFTDIGLAEQAAIDLRNMLFTHNEVDRIKT